MATVRLNSDAACHQQQQITDEIQTYCAEAHIFKKKSTLHTNNLHSQQAGNNNAKCKSYRAFNAVFGKVGRSASEEVIIQLLKTKCLPVLPNKHRPGKVVGLCSPQLF